MRALIVSLVLLAVPAVASAQACPYGLVAVDGVHCCWPGQAFASERGTCAGAPQCPPGLSPHGETCIVTETAVQPRPVAPAMRPLPPPPPPMPAGYAPMPQMPPQVFGHQVRFEASKPGNEFTVSVDDGVSCRTPCELMVAPGRHRVKVEGAARFRDDLSFPAGPSVVQIEKRNGGRAALGIVGLAVGIPAAVVGAGVGLLGAWVSAYSSGTDSSRTMMYAGFGVMAAGITLAAVGGGVGFGTAGRNRARFARSSADELGEAPVRLLSLGAAPTRGGGMVGATFAF